MLHYLSLDIICSSKLTVFLELRSRKTVHFSEQIMSVDKYPSIFLCQMKAIVYLFLSLLTQWHFLVFKVMLKQLARAPFHAWVLCKTEHVKGLPTCHNFAFDMCMWKWQFAFQISSASSGFSLRAHPLANVSVKTTRRVKIVGHLLGLVSGIFHPQEITQLS